MATFVRKILENRYSTYQHYLEYAPITWDEEINSWLVFDYELIINLLKSDKVSANRLNYVLDQLCIDHDKKIILQEFYSRWLMYMDAPEHTELRKKVQIPINRTLNKIELLVSQELDNINFFSLNKVEIVEEFSKPFTTKFMAQIFGLSLENYKLLLNKANEAIAFLWVVDPSKEFIENTANSIIETYSLIKSIIKEQEYINDRIFDLIVNNVGSNEEQLALIINLLVDGHEPFQSAVSSFIYHYFSLVQKSQLVLNEITSEQLVNETIRLEVPFPYCSREAVEEIKINNKIIKPGERIMMFISAGNRDSKFFKCPFHRENFKNNKPKTLTFGVGSHYCPGAQITQKALIQLANKMKEKDLNFKIESFRWEDTFGFRALKELNLVKKH